MVKVSELSIRAKYILITSAFLVIAIGSGTVLGTRFLIREYSKVLKSESLNAGQTLKIQLERILGYGLRLEDIIGFEKQCREIADRYPNISYAKLSGLDGKTLFHSNRSPDADVTDPLILDDLNGKNAVIRVRMWNGEPYYDAITPVLGLHGEVIGGVVVGFPQSVVGQKTDALFGYAIAIAIVSIAMAIASSAFVFSKWVDKPINQLLAVIRNIVQRGDVSATGTVDVRSNDEIGQLASSFNEMLQQLKQSRGKIQQYTQKLEREVKERIQTEKHLQASVAEKEVLLREIHHRVKNNLQVISSLLNLQSGTSEDTTVVEMLRESRDRVKSMALVHERLYQSKDLSSIEFGQYLERLCSSLLRSYGANHIECKVKHDVQGKGMLLDVAVPCGLIVNELVSNSLKHGFPDQRKGRIDIEIRSDDEKNFSLSVRDDGVGMPAGFDLANTKSLGLRLVDTLVDQLDGSIAVGVTAGADFEITFSQVAQGRQYA